ncbi:coiled-coil domain-containing protein 115 isoform X1 [Harpia harpyja]|uniref:coiled-coil domain-containing protein 115 isoform X1 n=1 Tax=Harpia harpyja TaxID=202280 RepID=UPI0022B1DA56|nr:coiled-coil domain-containing protein 115 isoform X1 [Harpia harpyja]
MTSEGDVMIFSLLHRSPHAGTSQRHHRRLAGQRGTNGSSRCCWKGAGRAPKMAAGGEGNATPSLRMAAEGRQHYALNQDGGRAGFSPPRRLPSARPRLPPAARCHWWRRGGRPLLLEEAAARREAAARAGVWRRRRWWQWRVGSPALDAAVLELLEALETLQQKRHLLTQLLRQGWLSLSQARYSLGCHRVSSLQYGATMVPRVRVFPRQDPGGPPHFEEVPGTGGDPEDPDPQQGGGRRAAAAPGSPRKRGFPPPAPPPIPWPGSGCWCPPACGRPRAASSRG